MAVTCGVRSPASHESKGVVPPAPWPVGQARSMAYSAAPAGYSVRPMSAPLAGLDRFQPFFYGPGESKPPRVAGLETVLWDAPANLMLSGVACVFLCEIRVAF